MDRNELMRRFAYSPEGGEFIRKVAAPGPNGQIGCIAGNAGALGYVQIMVCRKRYYAHRLAWLFVHGYWPKALDHVNGDRADNRLHNLREVSSSVNMRNRRMSGNNTSGVTGVCWDYEKGKWRVQISINRKQKHLGYFDDLGDAKEAREVAAMANGYTGRHGK